MKSLIPTKKECTNLKGNSLNYYAGGNTAKGFVHNFESNFQQLDRLYILKGGPGTGKSTLIKSIGNEWQEKGFDVEWIHCSSDVGSVDAVIIPLIKVGIVDGTAPHVIEPSLPGVVEDYVDLGVAWDRSKLLPNKERIIELNKKIKIAYQNAYSSFSDGLAEHDELEKIYIEQIDFDKANKLTNEWIGKLFGQKQLMKKSVVKHRFLGASTPEGPVDFVENLTEPLSNRYFIKGRAGSGKSTMLKKIAKIAEDKGYDVEIYHCGFDPNSLDMIIVRELDFAIFDSTAPHEYYPSREGDAVIDLYELTITPGTDEKYAGDINIVTKKYKDQMKKGIAYLAETKILRDQLESIYIEAMDFSLVNNIRNQINKDITAMNGK